MSALTDRIERDLREIAATARPSPSAWVAIQTGIDREDGEVEPSVADLPDHAPRRAERWFRRPLWVVGVAAAVAVVLVAATVAVVVARAGDGEVVATTKPDAPAYPASGGMWPQSTAAEVRAAQHLADQGDPAYTWQLDPMLAADGNPWDSPILGRFLEEKLGWDEYVEGQAFSSGYGTMGPLGGVYEGVLYIRCAPGRTNPLSDRFADAPPEIRRCAPTIDDRNYETVRLRVTQPGRRGPKGIWVVERWEILPAGPETGGSWGWSLLNPEFDGRRVSQDLPPAQADVDRLLEAFLRARMDGEGAERFVLRPPDGDDPMFVEVPLLYGTTAGVPYERYETDRLKGPVWPNGWLEYELRLIAADGTVVDQRFHVVRSGGQLGLLYGQPSNDIPTTENGRSVAVPHEFLDGEVTVSAAPPWNADPYPAPAVLTIGHGRRAFVLAADPFAVETGCDQGPAPVDPQALVAAVLSDPAFASSGSVPVRLGGVTGTQVDGVVTAHWDSAWASCHPMWMTNASVFRMRLYVLDHPGKAARTLTVAIIAPEDDFDQVLEETRPMLDSLRFEAS